MLTSQVLNLQAILSLYKTVTIAMTQNQTQAIKPMEKRNPTKLHYLPLKVGDIVIITNKAIYYEAKISDGWRKTVVYKSV